MAGTQRQDGWNKMPAVCMAWVTVYILHSGVSCERQEGQLPNWMGPHPGCRAPNGAIAHTYLFCQVPTCSTSHPSDGPTVVGDVGSGELSPQTGRQIWAQLFHWQCDWKRTWWKVLKLFDCFLISKAGKCLRIHIMVKRVTDVHIMYLIYQVLNMWPHDRDLLINLSVCLCLSLPHTHTPKPF